MEPERRVKIMAACVTCGADWALGSWTKDCAECGGGDLDRACVMCGGSCAARWKRAVLDSNDAKLAHWIGGCEILNHGRLAPLRLTLERGGGIAGSMLHERLGPIETERLEAGIRGRVAMCMLGLRFFEMDDSFPIKNHISDAMWYSISIEGPERARTIKWTDKHTIPEKLRELVRVCAAAGDWKKAS